MAATHRTEPFTAAQVRRLRQRAAEYAEQLVREGGAPLSAQRDAEQAYGLENQSEQREPAPDLPRALRRELLEHFARQNMSPDLPATPLTESERAARHAREYRARMRAARAAQAQGGEVARG